MEKFLNIVFGLCSLLGLAFAIATYDTDFSLISQLHDDTELLNNIRFLQSIFIYSVILLAALFIVQHYYYYFKVRKLNNKIHTTKDNAINIDYLNNHIKIIKQITESFHNISKSHHKTFWLLENCINHVNIDNANIMKSDIELTIEDFYKHIRYVTDQVASAMSLITNDSCSVHIALIRDDKYKIIQRNTISEDRRGEYDLDSSNNPIVYDISSNSSIFNITSEKLTDQFYVCDDLNSSHDFCNPSQYWPNEFNAILAVPIMLNVDKMKFHVFGVLVCDNFIGGFEVLELKDYLMSISYQLYDIFFYHDLLVQKIGDAGIQISRESKYNHW